MPVLLAVALVAGVAPPDPVGAQAGPPGIERLAGLPEGLPAGGGERHSAPVQARAPFSMVGLGLPPGAGARVRTSTDGSEWMPWVEAEVLAADQGPDAGGPEGTSPAPGGPAGRFTEPVWVGTARWLQVAVTGAGPGEVHALLVPVEEVTAADAAADDAAGTVRAAAAAPPMISRAEWGADESLRGGRPGYAPAARFAVVHHTAGPNGYSRSQAASVVRGIYRYHTQVLGWDDIGYNVLVDRYGRVFEGRAGGLDRAVVGAHARGFNTGSIGVALLGSFDAVQPPTEAVGAVADVLAWKFGLHGIGTRDEAAAVAGSSDRYRAGTLVTLAPIVGHRDVGRTECPGDRAYAQLPLLRRAVEQRGAPTRSTYASFADVVGHAHGDAVRRLATAGVTGGCGNGRFCPDRPITRAQAAAFLTRALALEGGAGGSFRDVPAGHAHAGAIAAAVGAGLLRGHDDGTFRPDSLLTRAHMATVLARAAGLGPVAGQRFTDVPTSSAHRGAINALARAGITTGCGRGRFCPSQPVTRGQLATFLWNGVLSR